MDEEVVNAVVEAGHGAGPSTSSETIIAAASS
jgi:hypothetical protein